MVTSGCPVLDKLRPQVRFHLPFPSVEETMYRSLTMYMMTQYLRRHRGLAPDWEMNNLAKTYEGITAVNTAFIERLKTIKHEEKSIDALLKLDCFAYYINLSLSDKIFHDLKGLYNVET